MCVCLIVFVCFYVDMLGTEDPHTDLSPKLVKGSIAPWAAADPQPRHCSAADIPPVAGAVFTWSFPRFKLESLGMAGWLSGVVMLTTPIHPHAPNQHQDHENSDVAWISAHWMMPGYMGTL